MNQVKATQPSRLVPEKHSWVYWLVSDALVMIRRSVGHVLKNRGVLIGGLLQSMVFMIIFRYVFGGAIETGGPTYINFLVAGILVQTAAFGAFTTASGVAVDMQRGIMNRLKSLPMNSSAMLTGHVTASLFRNTLFIIVMTDVAYVVGFNPSASPLEWFAAFGLLLLFTFSLSWLSAILGLVAKGPEAVQAFTFMVISPLTFASSAYVPTSSMPTALRIFAENQPITHVIETIRALLVGTPIGNHGWWALGWCIGIMAIAIPITAVLFRRYTPH